jgi:general secretion pathway protein B
MSYILEALKKLERKRPQEEASPALGPADSPGPEDHIKPLWLYLVALGIVFNGGLFFWWVFHPGSPKTPVPGRLPAPRVAPKVAVSPPPPVEADRSVFPPKKEPIPEPLRTPAKTRTAEERTPVAPPREKPSLSEKAKTPPPKPPAEKIPTPEPVRKPSPTTPAEKTAVSATAQAPPPTTKKEIPLRDRILQMNELPAEIRNALPPLKVSTHIYSIDPQSRLVRVNEQILQEGQVSLEGLKVEEIVPRGIVFRYQGYRFRMGI